MATFEVYFFGLICHVGDTEDYKSHAVIVDAPATQHVPLVVINSTPHRLRKGDNVRFGLPSGDVPTTEYFKEYVPGLRSLINGIVDIREEIMSATSDPDVVGYVSYPRDGALDVADLFETSASYVLDDVVLREDDCVARLTFIQIKTAETHIDVRYGNSVETVPANSWVLISNSSPANLRDHFSEYLRLTKGAAIAVAEPGNLECPLSGAAQYVDDVKAYLRIKNAKGFDKASVARVAARLERIRAAKASPAEGSTASKTEVGPDSAPPHTEATDVECSNSKYP